MESAYVSPANFLLEKDEERVDLSIFFKILTSTHSDGCGANVCGNGHVILANSQHDAYQFGANHFACEHCVQRARALGRGEAT